MTGGDLSPERRALLKQRLAAAGLLSDDRRAEPEIDTGDRDRPRPLSYGQERLWFMDQLAPGNPFYNIPVVTRIEGGLDVAALQWSIEALVGRHEVLRTSFALADGGPVQVVAGDAEVPLPVVDLTGEPADRRQETAQRCVNEEVRRPFDLATGPVMRARLLRLSPDEHWLILTIHHIVADGWSMGILGRELAALYGARLAGKDAVLEPLPIQYADYAAWQREWLQGDVLEEQLGYWREQLRDIPILDLPTDRPRDPEPTFQGDFHRFDVSSEVAELLDRLARDEGATLYMVLLAGFHALLSRLTGQDDVVVGSPIANRTRSEVEDLIGFFVNTLVMREDVSGNPTFRELLGRVRRTALAAFAHQDLPFEKLVDEVQPERDLSRNPLFQVGFVLQTAWRASPGAGGPGGPLADDRGQPQVQRGSSIFDLAVHLWEREDGIGGGFEYSTALFDAATIERLATQFVLLLESVAFDPEVRVGDVPLLREHERHRIVTAWNRTDADYPDDTTFHQLFEEHARVRPDAPAVRFLDQELTYGELDRRANQLARVLQRAGVGRGSLVPICLNRSVEMLVALLAVMKAGGAYVPLDPTYPAERLRYMLDDSSASVVVTHRELAATALDGVLTGEAQAVLSVDELGDELATVSDTSFDSPVGPSDLAYVIYTSGSTGRPKGVMVEHRGLCNVAAAQQTAFGVGSGSRVLQFASLSFDASIFEISLALASGGTLCVAPADDIYPGPALLELLERERVTIVVLPPSALAALPTAALPELDTITVAGEACPESLVDAWATGRRFFNLYGPTEATIWATWAECLPGGGRPSIGRPIGNTRVYLLDDGGEPVPVGVRAELCIGGVGVARGYLNRPELTRERFVEVQLAGEPERVYRTGDVARFLPDGNIDFLGRTDQQVKLRGFRIELEEIENVLTTHPSIQESAVVVREDAPDDKRLVAYVTTPDDMSSVNPAAADEYSAEQVSLWQAMYDDMYRGHMEAADPAFNIAGWNSSYTGQPLPAAEMREWVDDAVDRIVSLRPSRVLEIGCGSGLILFRVAPHCDRYLATDFSAPALEYVARHLDPVLGAGHGVTLEHRTADDFDGLEAGEHDLVVLNSVVQYFPSGDYLRNVLTQAVGAVAPGGAVFVGDVRNLALLETFALSVETTNAQGSVTIRELEDRAARRLMVEQELAVDPGFFSALQAACPEITQVEVLAKRAGNRNELTKFRYDIILHVGGGPATLDGSDPGRRPADALPPELAGLTRRVDDHTLYARGIPDSRLEDDLAIRAALAGLDPDEPVARLWERLPEPRGGLNPATLAASCEERGFTIEVHESPAHGAGTFDAVLYRREHLPPGERPPVPAGRSHGGPSKPWGHYTNSPYRGIFLRKMVPSVRRHLATRLPAHMIPGQYVLLDRFPRTPGGKLDRAALPVPTGSRPDLGVDFVAPTVGLERTLASIWAEVLGIDEVGIHDNYFGLGGDSILGIQIIARARDAGLDLMPKHLFEHQTIAELVRVATVSESPPPKEGPRPAEADSSGVGVSPRDFEKLMHQLGATGQGTQP